MGVVVAAIVAGLLIYCFACMRKMVRWNNDPRSQKLIQLFLTAGRTADLVDEIKITNFLCEQDDWSLSEDRTRVAQALSAVQRISDRAVSEKAKDIGLSIGCAINAGQLRGA